jgi:hypothetical protein
MKGAMMAQSRILLTMIITIGILAGSHVAGVEAAQLDLPSAEDMTQVFCEADRSPMLVAQAEGTQGEQPSGDVQERAVPRMGPGGTAPMPGHVEGAILDKGRVRVQPGYVLQQQADGSVMARRAGGGSGGSSFSCFCALGKGGCKMIVQGGSAWCSKTADNPCSNTCDMKISKFSEGGMIMQ